MLETIGQANDIKKIRKEDLGSLAQEIRDFLIRTISVTGGHLGANLGAVELTMALHLALNLPKDKIIWDVGHQSYTHKILTGRKGRFETLRQFHGLSGFPKRKESECDVFDTGHSSTSLSAGLGLVKAREITGGSETIVSVIGDGSLTGGMAYEALNNAAKLETNFIIILNDNNMSISENVGGMSKYLNSIRTASGYLDLKKGIYNALQGTKRGDSTISRIRRAQSSFTQVVIPGMMFEDMGITYLGPVDGHDIPALVATIQAAKRVEGAVMIHALTEKGRGYRPAERHPARFHGFLQRAYDQILHDVCLQNLPVVFAIDRAGLVGSDGETHQGVFDLTYLSGIPNMHICAPKNKWELSDMLKFAVSLGAPVAVRYPRGTAYAGLKEHREPVSLGRAEWIYREREIALFALGSMVKTAEDVRERLKAAGHEVSLVNARFVKPIDEEAVAEACGSHNLIVTMEENVACGGYGEKVLAYMNEKGLGSRFLGIAVPDVFVEHGNVELLKQEIGMDAEGIVGRILERIGEA